MSCLRTKPASHRGGDRLVLAVAALCWLVGCGGASPQRSTAAPTAPGTTPAPTTTAASPAAATTTEQFVRTTSSTGHAEIRTRLPVGQPFELALGRSGTLAAVPFLPQAQAAQHPSSPTQLLLVDLRARRITAWDAPSGEAVRVPAVTDDGVVVRLQHQVSTATAPECAHESCWHWTLALVRPDGTPVTLASGGPVPQDSLPVPTALGHQVVWQQLIAPKLAGTFLLDTAAAAPTGHQIASGHPADEPVLVPTAALLPDLGDGRLYRVDLNGHEVTAFDTAGNAVLVGADASQVCWARPRGPQTSRKTVLCRAIAGASPVVAVGEEQDLYAIAPLPGDRVLVDGFQGLQVAPVRTQGLKTSAILLGTDEEDTAMRIAVDGRTVVAGTRGLRDKASDLVAFTL